MPTKSAKVDLLPIKDVVRMAKEEGVSIPRETLNYRVKNGKIPGAVTERPGPTGGLARHLIPEPQARKIVDSLKRRQELLETHDTIHDVVRQARGLKEILPHGRERELRLNLNKEFIRRLIKSKKVKGAIRDPSSPGLDTWLIPKDQVNEVLSRVLQLNAPRITGYLRIDDVVRAARRQSVTTSREGINWMLKHKKYGEKYRRILGVAKFLGKGGKPDWLISPEGARRLIACARVKKRDFMRETVDMPIEDVESLAKSIAEATRSGAYFTAVRAAGELRICVSTLYKREGVPWETYAGQKYLKGDAVRALKRVIDRERAKRGRRKRK